MDAARGVLFEETSDRRSVAQRIEQFDLGVGQFDEDDGHAMVRLVLRGADLGAQRVAILRRRGLEVGHGDGDMVQASDHCGLLCGLAARPTYRPGACHGQATKGRALTVGQPSTCSTAFTGKESARYLAEG
jgi:hypothetical protein